MTSTLSSRTIGFLLLDLAALSTVASLASYAFFDFTFWAPLAMEQNGTAPIRAFVLLMFHFAGIGAMVQAVVRRAT